MENTVEIDRSRLLPLYILRTGIKDPQYPIIRRQGYPAWQLSVCFRGAGKFICGGHEHEIRRGDVFLFGPRVPHEYFSSGGDWGIHFFAFSGDSVQGIEAYMGINDYAVVSIPEGTEYDKCMEMVHRIHDAFNGGENRELKASALLYMLIGEISSYMSGKYIKTGTEKNEAFSYTAPVTEYMRNNFKRQISLDDMAEVIGVSKSYLCRMFRSAYGITPVKVLMRIRIAHARMLLASTDMKIKQLAEECGFCDTSYFCASFRRAEGMTPEEFRRLQTE